MAESEGTHDLAEQAAAGDRVALKLLLTRHHGALARYIERRMSGRLAGVVGTEDILQEAYLDAFRHVGTFRSTGPDAFYRWLATLALNRLRKALRQHRISMLLRVSAFGRRDGGSTWCRMHDVMTPGPTASRAAMRDEATQALERAMMDLPERYRMALWLVRISGLSIGAAAERMGCTERAIQGLLRRGRDLLRDRLGGTDPVFPLRSHR